MRGEILIPSSLFGWTIIALLAFGVHATGQGLTSVALRLVALAILAQPPFSALTAWGVLGEGMTVLQIAGGAIILAAVVISRPTAGPSRRAKPSLTGTGAS